MSLRGWPDRPLEQASALPKEYYLTEDHHQLQLERIFRANWIAVGLVEQVARPGQFFTAELAGEPLLVIRDQHGELRALSNVCRHRAARVMCQDHGLTDRLRCRYHGWTYDLSGSLRGVPEFEGVADFRREDHALPQSPVAIWGPLVFVHLGQPAEELPRLLEPLISHASVTHLTSFEFVRSMSYEVNCNWKVYIDNYLDGGYHVNTIHESLASVLDYKNYSITCSGKTCLQASPVRSPEATADASAADVRSGSHAAYWWVYPNLMLNIYDQTMDVNRVYPLAADRCRVDFDFFFAKSGEAAQAAWREKSIQVADRVQQEDVMICEDVQTALASQTYAAGRYSVRRERGVYEFHRQIAAALGTLTPFPG